MEELIGQFKEKFDEALEDDFNTAQALGYFHDLSRKLNRLAGQSESEGQPEFQRIL